MEDLLSTLLGAVIGSVFSILTTLYVIREEKKKTKVNFLIEKSSKFYLPLSLYLTITKGLFERFHKASAEEKEMIEHAQKEYNTKIKELILQFDYLLESDFPREKISDLLQHIAQWDLVYKLKYEDKTYQGPVFAGIEMFGNKRFPTGIDEYFQKKSDELREKIHSKMS